MGVVLPLFMCIRVSTVQFRWLFFFASLPLFFFLLFPFFPFFPFFSNFFFFLSPTFSSVDDGVHYTSQRHDWYGHDGANTRSYAFIFFHRMGLLRILEGNCFQDSWI